MTEKRVSVVVCTHGRPGGLAALLASLRPQLENRRNRELIVVNDGTHGPHYDAVLEPYRDFVRYEPLPASVGIAHARNRSAELAEGEFLVFTDDDCVVPPHWLDWLEARVATQPELDVIAGTTRPHDPGRANFVGRVQAHYDLLPRPYRQESGEQLFVTACVAIRTSLFRMAGGFNTRPPFAVAGEDSELAARLHRRLARTRVDFDWHVFHVLTTSLRAEVRRYRRYGFANGLTAKERTAPQAHAALQYKRRRDLPRYFLHHYRRNRAKAAGFSDNPLVRAASLLALALIQAAYDEGSIAGTAEWRRRQTVK